MNLIGRWREKRNREWWDRWHREHRWDELADYNSRVSKGIVHDPEYSLRMAREQREFDLEHGHTEWWDDQGDGIIGRSKYGWISK